MDVVEVAVSGNVLVDHAPQIRRGGGMLEAKLDRTRRRRGDREQEIVPGRALRADQERGRAPEMGERGLTECVSLRQRGRGHVDAAEQLTRRKDVGMVAGDEV